MGNFKTGYIFIMFLMILNFQSLAQSITITSAGGASADNIPEMLTSNLYNSSGADITGYLSFIIKSNNTIVLSGTTEDLTVPTLGNLTINELNAEKLLMPLSYTYIESSISGMVNNSNTLPNGNYQIFLEFMVSNTPESSVFNNYKFIGTNSTGGNLVLITPFNNSETPTLTPFFTWVGLGNDVLYEIKITEVLPGQVQSHGASINNTAFHFEDDLNSFNYFYGLSAPELQECTYYEWQVTAYEETFTPGEGGGTTTRTNIATSEVFRFGSECGNEALRVGAVSNFYMTLNKTSNSFPYEIEFIDTSVGPTLIPFKYQEKYGTPKAVVTISNLTDPNRYCIYTDTLNSTDSLLTGVNYFGSIKWEDLEELEDCFERGNLLLLSLTNARGELWRAKFRIKEEPLEE